MEKYAVITGAASGIGKETCRDLLSKGWRVFGIDLNAKGLASIVHDTEKSRANFISLICDITDANAINIAFEKIREYTPILDALICSAGIFRTSPLAEMAVEDFDAVFSVNTRGNWLTARAALPFLQRNDNDAAPGRIVFVASIAAIRPKVGGGAYAASKTALAYICRVMAAELAVKGILVNAIAPSTVDTPMVDTLQNESGPYSVSGVSPLVTHCDHTRYNAGY